MRRLRLAFGLLLLLIGVILVSISRNSKEEIQLKDVGFREDSWEVDGLFWAKDTIVIHIGPGENWHIFFNDPSVIIIRSFNLTISGGGGETLFNVSISGPDPKYQPEMGIWVPLCLADIKLIHGNNLDDAVSAEIIDPTMIKLGVARASGLYTVRIDKEYWMVGPQGDDPPTLGLYKRISNQSFPYAFLLPVGSSFGILGVVVAVWGVISSKPKKLSRRKTGVDAKA